MGMGMKIVNEQVQRLSLKGCGSPAELLPCLPSRFKSSGLRL